MFTNLEVKAVSSPLFVYKAFVKRALKRSCIEINTGIFKAKSTNDLIIVLVLITALYSLKNSCNRNIRRKFMLKKLIAIAMAAALCCGAMAACTGGEQKKETPKAVQSTDNYRNFYQIFMYSFCDSNDDGVGDFKGIISRLDYLNDGDPNGGNDLGIDGIWLTPINPSESYHKYSVEDYKAVDKEFGTLDDFKTLLKEADKRGINVILDLVLNHSSDQHPWFVKACQEVKEGKLDGYAQYYHIVKKDDEVGSSTYLRIDGTDYYYEANFDKSMPELNLSNEKVREEIKDIMKFWLDMGVSGFRLDAIKYYDTGGDDGQEFCKWLVDTAKDIKKDAYIVGENWSGTSQIADWYSTGIDSQFNFPMSQAIGTYETAVRSGDANKLCKSVKSWGETIADKNENAIDCSFLSNHDISRSGAALGKNLQNEKMAAMSYMLSPGNPFIYYGEEVGLLGSTDNDGSYRLPMPWNGTEWENIHLPSIAFSIAEESVVTTVEKAQKDDNSLLKTYQQLIKLKLQNPEIARGKITDVIESDSDNAAGYVTKYNDSGVIIFYNLSKTESAAVDVPKDKLEYSGIAGQVTAQDPDSNGSYAQATLDGTSLTIPPMTVVVLK